METQTGRVIAEGSIYQLPFPKGASRCAEDPVEHGITAGPLASQRVNLAQKGVRFTGDEAGDKDSLDLSIGGCDHVPDPGWHDVIEI